MGGCSRLYGNPALMGVRVGSPCKQSPMGPSTSPATACRPLLAWWTALWSACLKDSGAMAGAISVSKCVGRSMTAGRGTTGEIVACVRASCLVVTFSIALAFTRIEPLYCLLPPGAWCFARLRKAAMLGHPPWLCLAAAGGWW